MEGKDLDFLDKHVNNLSMLLNVNMLKIQVRILQKLLEKHDPKLFKEYAEMLIAETNSDKTHIETIKNLEQLRNVAPPSNPKSQ